VEEAKATDLMEIASSLGARLKRAGSGEYVGPCPTCGGDDRFGVNTKKKVFICRGSAAGGVIDMVMHANGTDFIGACEFINGSKPPRGESRPVDRDYLEQKKDERREREMDREAQESKARSVARTNSEKLWDIGVPLIGSYAEQYLRRRGIVPTPAQVENLKFVPDLKFFGTRNEEDEDSVCLGSFPCMIAAMRNSVEDIVAIHRTYLDPDVPRRLAPPAGPWNKTKKVSGKPQGAGIWLGPLSTVVAISEGIETGLSWQALGRVKDEAVSVVAAYSLGNIASIAFPEEVRKVHIIGDGDANWRNTYPTLLKAIERFQRQDIEVGFVDIPRAQPGAEVPKGFDWNDVLLQTSGGGAA
jgi:phage/plasmid primase-like uncharacterized protein